MAEVANDITQTAFAAKTFTTRVKDDGTPVTEVDIAVEESLVRLVANHRPDDAVLSEELGACGRSRRTWIIDGIDGTAAFARGDAGWGTLIALRIDDDVTVGVATSPGLSRRWWAARGAGAWAVQLPAAISGSDPQPLAVSRTDVDNPRWSVIPTSQRLDGWRRQVGSLPGTATGSAHDPLRVAEGALDGVVVLYGGPVGSRALRRHCRGSRRQVQRPLGWYADRRQDATRARPRDGARCCDRGELRRGVRSRRSSR